jgi:hypothetical protein
MTVNLPAFTSNPPHIHHRKTTFCTPFLPKPPAKTPVIPARKNTAKMTNKKVTDSGQVASVEMTVSGEREEKDNGNGKDKMRRLFCSARNDTAL